MGRVFESRVVFTPAPSADWWLDGAAVDLDFQTPQYYDGADGADVTTLLSCSRASIGYAQTAAGTLTQFAADTLRITDLGLLVEKARTNLMVRSQEFDNAGQWNPNNSSVSADAGTAPDGTTTADNWNITSSAVDTFARQALGGFVNQAANVKHTLSIYIKPITGSTWVRLLNDAFPNFWGSWFNLSGSGAVGSSHTGGTGVLDSAAIEALANGWYRISIIGHYTADANGYYEVLAATADSALAGNSGDVYRLWGAQAEVGTLLSSYIPTAAAAATRAADRISCLSSLNAALLGAAGSVVVDATIPDFNFGTLIGCDDGSVQEMLLYTASNTDVANYNVGAGHQIALGNSKTWATGAKGGDAWDVGAGTASVVGGGGTVRTDAYGDTGATNFGVGTFEGFGPTNVFGYFRRITAWTTRLADATLQGFTYP